MPSVAQESPSSAVQCKKRRREDGDHTHNTATTPLPLFTGTLTKPISAPDGLFYSAFASADANSHINICGIPPEKSFDHGPLFHHHHHASPLVRKIIPLPSSKRQRVFDDEDIIRSPDDHPMRRRLSSPSQQRQLQEKSPNPRSTPARTAAASAKLMGRCHICGRKPTKKSDLDSFADCQGCSQRTCYVCIRECLGWRGGAMPKQQYGNGTGATAMGDAGGSRLSESLGSDSSFTMVDAEDLSEEAMGHHQTSPAGMQEKDHRPQETGGWVKGGHRQVVCSQCCVERGANGDVVCLGCLAFIEG